MSYSAQEKVERYKRIKAGGTHPAAACLPAQLQRGVINLRLHRHGYAKRRIVRREPPDARTRSQWPKAGYVAVDAPGSVVDPNAVAQQQKKKKHVVCFSNLKDGVYKSIRHFFLLLTRDMSKQLGDINRSLARAHRTLEHENDALIVLKDKLETAVDRNTGSSLTGKAWMAFDKIKAGAGVSDPKKETQLKLKLEGVGKAVGRRH